MAYRCSETWLTLLVEMDRRSSMPWREFTRMSERSEFAAFARRPRANMSELCRRYKISRQTGYKWLKRTGSGEGDVEDRSRRPLSSPQQTAVGIESQVLAVREQ